MLDVEARINISADDLMAERGVILGASRTGKSNTVAVFVEEYGEVLPFIIIDPHGEYYGLREKFPAMAIIGRSDHVDVQATSAQAPALARWAYENNRSVVLDLLYMSDAERHEFVIAFFTALWQRAIRQRRPYLIVIDEAHNFLPEKGNPEVKVIMKRVALEGGKFGLAILLATQTTTEIAKFVLKQCAHRILHAVFDYRDVVAYQERSPLRDAETEAIVLSLAVGQALYVYRRSAVVVQIRKRTTYHAADTPKVGAETLKLPPIDSSLLDELAEFLDSPPGEDDDGQYRAHVERLERQIAELQNRPPEQVIVHVPVPVFKPGQVEALRMTQAQLQDMHRVIDDVIAEQSSSDDVGGWGMAVGSDGSRVVSLDNGKHWTAVPTDPMRQEATLIDWKNYDGIMTAPTVFDHDALHERAAETLTEIAAVPSILFDEPVVELPAAGQLPTLDDLAVPPSREGEREPGYVTQIILKETQLAILKTAARLPMLEFTRQQLGLAFGMLNQGWFVRHVDTLLESGHLRLAEDGVSLWMPNRPDKFLPITGADILKLWSDKVPQQAAAMLNVLFTSGGGMTRAYLAEMVGMKPQGWFIKHLDTLIELGLARERFDEARRETRVYLGEIFALMVNAPLGAGA